MDQFLMGSQLAHSALLSALIKALTDKGILTPFEAREIFESALLMNETRQGVSPINQEAFEVARKLIEDLLQTPQRKP